MRTFMKAANVFREPAHQAYLTNDPALCAKNAVSIILAYSITLYKIPRSIEPDEYADTISCRQLLDS